MAVSDDELQKAKDILGAALDAKLESYLGRISEVVFRAVVDVLHSPEFAGLRLDQITESVAHRVWSIDLDPHRPYAAGEAHRSGDLLAEIDAHTYHAPDAPPAPAE